MPNRVTLRNVKGKEFGLALRRRLQLAPDEEVEVTVIKREVSRETAAKDPWAEIKGILTPEKADEMIRAIIERRRSKTQAPRVGEP